MNIFYLDHNPKLAASYHCDKHVVKMILESAQMISTVFHKHGLHEDWMTKPCFQNHPCTKWAGNRRENLKWLIALGISLNEQYTLRYKKQHKYLSMFCKFKEMNLNFLIGYGATSEPALAMPDDCKIDCGYDSAVYSYRLYYMRYKKQFAEWKHTEIPFWYKPESL